MHRKLPTPAQEAAAATLRDRLVADKGGPQQVTEAESMLIDLVTMAVAMHSDAARYLATALPRPWVDRRSKPIDVAKGRIATLASRLPGASTRPLSFRKRSCRIDLPFVSGALRKHRA